MTRPRDDDARRRNSEDEGGDAVASGKMRTTDSSLRERCALHTGFRRRAFRARSHHPSAGPPGRTDDRGRRDASAAGRERAAFDATDETWTRYRATSAGVRCVSRSATWWKENKTKERYRERRLTGAGVLLAVGGLERVDLRLGHARDVADEVDAAVRGALEALRRDGERRAAVLDEVLRAARPDVHVVGARVCRGRAML